MNGNFFQNPTFPSSENLNTFVVPEEEKIEEISNPESTRALNMNRGKKVKIYTSFPFSNESKDRIFEGIFEGSQKDILIISNPETGEWNIIPTGFINYISFDEKIIF